MPSSDTDRRLTRLEEQIGGKGGLHEKVDNLADALQNHIATDVRRLFKTMGAVIVLLLGVLGALLWPYFSGGPQ